MENGFYGHNDISVNDYSSNTIKVKWWLSMPFIWIVVFITSFLFCIPAIVLFCIRLVKYPTKRKAAIVSVIVPFIAFLVLVVVFVLVDSKKDKEIQEEIKNGNYDNAISMINDRYTTSSYDYYSAMADVYEEKGDFDKAASYIIDYIKNNSIDSLEDKSVDRLIKMKSKTSENIVLEIDNVIDVVKEAERLKGNVEENKEAVLIDSATPDKTGETVAEKNMNPVEVVASYYEAKLSCDTEKAVSYCSDNLKSQVTLEVKELETMKQESDSEWMDILVDCAQEIFLSTATSYSDVIDAEYLREDEDIKNAVDDFSRFVIDEMFIITVINDVNMIDNDTAVVEAEISTKTNNQHTGNDVLDEYLQDAVLSKLSDDNNLIKKQAAKKIVKESMIKLLEDYKTTYSNGETVAMGKRIIYLRQESGEWKIFQIDSEDY